ncbi:MAG: disulfide bond formation protein B [Pseudomonadales bacterium]|jgi:disulfide bond formation protein DsbB|nr:disulfide bond formation protein B [Pseudomonadales bacterium]MDP6469860.1 disulfide bond formation protein B [Pseudomonadales bacterium]MDP6827538.1 disulfide bond formation protein B [Pseudomonadales bacterium]MDP6971330.1 disulfide bond formation protein B [Pseudomonadales bacterium]|tara:strand:+ start:2016 stop:2495 length:480 start_codon:yes stop_codon:yes gene_type:complete
MIASITSEQWAMTIALACGGVLSGALVMEHGFGMAPCPLCLMQRIWFFFAGAFACASLAHNPRWGIYPLMSLVCCLVGGGFAVRQLWLQSLPEDQVPACTDLARMFEVSPLGDVLVAMTQGTGDCAKVDLVLGVTLPLWTLLAFIGIAVLAILQLRARQ